jgi:ADP-ribosylglycohydrolase
MLNQYSPLGLLTEELRQRSDEECNIPDNLRSRIKAVADEWDADAVEPLYDELMTLEANADLAALEPNDLDAIRQLRPDGRPTLPWQVTDAERLDRFHGAWTGRATGCALGKPVEGMGFGIDESGNLAGRKRIKSYLQNRDDWPLRDYFSMRDVGDDLRVSCPKSCREKIAFMEPDDDIHYSLIGLAILEESGPEFTWQHVARYWFSHMPLSVIHTAEFQAIRNAIAHPGKMSLQGLTPEFTRRNRNPFREWIGAQIRADGWAWACAGKPELAAEFAWRDAHWTHERNGIYGEMFFAAIIAAAFVESDPAKLIQIGLGQIPAQCRLANAVRDCLGWIEECADWEACMDRIEAAFSGKAMHPVHTINNALICVLSLFYGNMDTVEAPAIAVMCGLDTDCNGATVGSIVGAAAGRAAFRPDLADRLNDTIRPSLIGFEQITMTALAERTLKVWKTIDSYRLNTTAEAQRTQR